MDKYPIPKICHLCGSIVKLTSNSKIYGKEYGNGKCYLCTGCGAYVGTHGNGITPLGCLSDKEMREMKKYLHGIFDKVWKSKKKSRGQAYQELSKALGINPCKCHIGHFNKDELHKYTPLIEEYVKSVM